MADSSTAFPQTPFTTPKLEKLNAADWRVILLWILAGLIATGVAWRYYFKAFPEASVNFQVSRAQVLDIGRQFVTAQGANLNGYQSTIVFNVNDDAKTYLERTVGLEQANKLLATQVSAWSWTIRFFRPQQHEEYRVRISPAGKVVGYRHIIEESQAGPKLDFNGAEQRAADFLTNQLHDDLSNYVFLPEEANPTDLPARRDWDFSWERKNFRVPDNAGGATYRIQVTIQGDQPGYAAEFLKVPDDWVRGYARLRSSNNLVETYAIIPYFILYGAAFWVIFELSKLGLLRWGAPVKIGLVLAGLWFLNSINSWPNLRAQYDTNSSYSAFFFNQIMIAALYSLLQGLLVTFAFAPGEAMYRLTQPDRVQLQFAVRRPGLRSKEFFRACVIGLCLAAVHIGYIVVFYIVAQRHGAWVPQDINYQDALSTSLPWLEAMVIGLFAASSEEFLFRMFAIPFVDRVFKNKFLAVVLPAFAWGFLHANYPQEPAYIRGVEIGMMGILAGIVFLRWGILATFIWHYTVDATLGSLLLLRSASPYLRISGAVVSGLAFIPLIFAAVMYVMRGGFEVHEEALNRALPIKAPPAAETHEAPAEATIIAGAKYEAISNQALVTIAFLAVVGVAILLSVHTKTVGSYIRFKMDARQAATQGDAILRQIKADPTKYRRAVINNFNLETEEGELVTKYLVEKLGVDGANRVYENQVPQAFWRVRYFRDSQQEEYAVIFRADGTLHSIWHTLDDRAPGPNLTKEQALQIAALWLQKFKNIDFSQWHFVSADSDKKPHRTDHVFVWEQNKPIAGGPDPNNAAFIRMTLQVNGFDISQYRVYIKLPEQWELDQTKSTLRGSILGVWRWAFPSLIGVFAIVVFFREFKRASAIVPWRRFAIWAAISAAAFLVTEYTGIPQTLMNYTTSIPFRTFVSTVAVGIVLSVVVLLGAYSLLFGLADYFLTRSGIEPPLPHWRELPANYFRDALITGVAGTAIWLGYERLKYLIFVMLHPKTGVAASSVPPGLDANHPALQQLAMMIYQGIGGIAILGMIAGFIAAFVKQTWMRVLVLIGFALVLAGAEVSAAQFAAALVLSLVSFGIVWWGIRVIRFNVLGYFLILAFLALLPAAIEWYKQPNAYIRTNAVTLFIAIGLLVVVPLVFWLKGDGKSGSANAAPVLSETQS